MRTALVVGLGGFIGAIARHLTSASIDRHLHGYFPFGTAIVNVLGCLLLGFIVEGCREGLALGPETREFLIVGLIGAFTTFSTFGFDTVQLSREGYPFSALANVVLSVSLGLLAILAGGAIARVCFR